MVIARETGGPPPAIFETRRTLVVPSGDPDLMGFGDINSATELQVFVSLRAGAADQTRFIVIEGPVEEAITRRSAADPIHLQIYSRGVNLTIAACAESTNLHFTSPTLRNPFSP